LEFGSREGEMVCCGLMLAGVRRWRGESWRRRKDCSVASSKKRIRMGVAGLGRIGWGFHCRQIAASKDFALAAVADPEAARRDEAVKTFGCQAFESFEAMLDGCELDGVVVATPTHFHKPHALAAFKRGLHAVVEKPMAACLADAQAIARAALKAERVLTVYQPHRVAAPFQHIRRIVESGRIGRVYHVRVGLFNYSRRDDWQSLRKFGGGMLNNYGAHALDMTLQLTGADVKKVFCNLRRVATLGDAEDVVKVVYETRDGAVGEADINQACALPPYEFEVYGTCGAIAKRKGQLVTRWFDPKKLASKSLNPGLASANRQYPRDDIPWQEETVDVDKSLAVDFYADLARAIRTGRPPLADPRETLAVLKLMEACRTAGGKIVSMEL